MGKRHVTCSASLLLLFTPHHRWVIQSEVFPIALRGKGNGVATAVNWICNLVVSITYLSMINTMTTAGTFWFYAGLSLIFWLLVFFFVPEVRKIWHASWMKRLAYMSFVYRPRVILWKRWRSFSKRKNKGRLSSSSNKWYFGYHVVYSFIPIVLFLYSS